MKKKKREGENFILELPLIVEQWQGDLLNKRYEYLRQVYNYIQRKLIKQYRYFSQMTDYKSCKTKKAKSDFFNTHSFNIKGFAKPIIFSKMKSKEIPQDLYGIIEIVAQMAKHKIGNDKTYKNLGLNTNILQYLGTHIWSAWEKVLYGKGKRVSLRKRGDVNTLSVIKKGGNFTGLDIDLEHFCLHFNLNGVIGKKAEKLKLQIKSDKLSEYEKYALKGGVESIRVITIVRKFIRGKYKYYVQFTIEGDKPQKGRVLGKGNVGIDVGPSTIAVSSLNGVHIDTIAEKCDNIEKDLYLLQRKIDRSLRATNQQNYNENGTIKRIDKKNGEKRVWKLSKRCIALYNKRKELYRKQTVIRKLQHNIKANELLSLGDTFIVENNPISAWARRSKETKKNKKGKIQSKKRFGKSVANHAPAQQITILENKVKSLGGNFIKVDIKNGASRFDFTNNEFKEHGLSERQITLSNGNTHQRDMLAAFNLQHIDLTTDEYKKYNIEDMARDYPIYCKMEEKEVQLFKQNLKQRHKSTIGI